MADPHSRVATLSTCDVYIFIVIPVFVVLLLFVVVCCVVLVVLAGGEDSVHRQVPQRPE